MAYRPALTCWRRFSNRRGAVLLLAVYFTSLVLLILGGISLQRTTLESRAAQVSRDAQQAFFLAEGALDVVLRKLRTGDLPEGTYQYQEGAPPPNLPELPVNTTVTLTTLAAQIVDPQTQQITREITTTGTASGTTATVTATVASTGPLKGVWTKGPLWVQGSGIGSGTGIFQGDLRSALGIVSSIKLSSKVKHEGQLQIGESEATIEEFDLASDPQEDTAWAPSFGTAWDWNAGLFPGVHLLASSHQSPSSQPCATCAPASPATIVVAPMLPPAPILSPYAANQCSGNITTTTGQQLTITDGNLNPKDLSPANDNTIILCLQYLKNTAAGAKVIFQSPATVYLTAQTADGYAVQTKDLYTVHPGYLVPDTAPLTSSGLKLVVTKAPEGRSGTVELQTKRFAGSIYAPESIVYFYTTSNSEYRLENIVARETRITTFGLPLSINNNPASPQTAPNAVTIQSWTSN